MLLLFRAVLGLASQDSLFSSPDESREEKSDLSFSSGKDCLDDEVEETHIFIYFTVILITVEVISS